MERKRVSSSNIEPIGYDSEIKTLEIRFHNGGTYQYFNVPNSIYTGIMNVSSHGEYFHAHIKAVYRYEKTSR